MSRYRVTYSHTIKDDVLYVPVRHIQKEREYIDNHKYKLRVVGFTIVMFMNQQYFVCDGLKDENGDLYKRGSIWTKDPRKGGKPLAESMWTWVKVINQNEMTHVDTVTFYQEDNPDKEYTSLYKFNCEEY